MGGTLLTHPLTLQWDKGKGSALWEGHSLCTHLFHANISLNPQWFPYKVAMCYPLD